MTVVIALVSSAGGGLVSWFLITKTLMKAEAKVAATEEENKIDEVNEALEKGAAFQLEPFVVNLADTDAARYLRIKISLMVSDKGKAKEVEENTALQLKVRDVILDTLIKKTSHELINEEGKKKHSEEIQEKIAMYFQE